MNKSLKFQNQLQVLQTKKVNKLKTKDSKKVAAGKKLAELNKTAKRCTCSRNENVKLILKIIGCQNYRCRQY